MNKGLFIIAALAAGGLAGCGAAIAPASTPNCLTSAAVCAGSPTLPAGDNVPPQTEAPTPTANTLEGPVGTVFTDTDAQNNEMQVTLTAVVNPARGSDEFDQPDNGNHFVAAKFSITGVSGTFSDDANSDATLIGSDQQSYQPDFDDVRGCTNFNSGEFSVATGQTSVGCVVFQIPNGIAVAQIEWGGGFDSAPAIWDV